MITNKKIKLYFLLFLFFIFNLIILKKNFLSINCETATELNSYCLSIVSGNLEIKYKAYLISILFFLFLPIIYYFNSIKEKNYFPIFFMIIAYFSLSYFGFYFFGHESFLHHLDENNLPVFSYLATITDVLYSMQIFLIGLIFFCLGYFLCNFFSIDKYIKFNIF